MSEQIEKRDIKIGRHREDKEDEDDDDELPSLKAIIAATTGCRRLVRALRLACLSIYVIACYIACYSLNDGGLMMDG